MADTDRNGSVSKAEAARWAVISLVVFGAGMVVGDMRSTLSRHDSGLADVAAALRAQEQLRASDRKDLDANRKDLDNLIPRVLTLEKAK